MEQPMDALKVYKHSQHVRLLQEEDDDMWISSEDLRTEGSSDEDTPRKSNKKSSKQMKNEALLRKTILTKTEEKEYKPSSSLYEVDDEEFLRIKSKCERENSLKQSGSLGLDSTVIESDDSNVFPSSSGSSGGCGTSESDVEALNLEVKWRPKRGSLKLPNLIEGDTNEHLMFGLNSFYNDMLLNIHTLKRTPVIQEADEIVELEGIEKLDETKRKHDMKETRDFIKKLEDEIYETISIYKTERAERLKTQNEMCKAISDDGVNIDRQSQLFLDMCNFQINGEQQANGDGCDIQEDEVKNEPKKVKSDVNNKFIQRNIELAKQGNMSSCSLTDEEKAHLENLLIDIDDLYTTEANKESQKENAQSSNMIDSSNSQKESTQCLTNAYKMSDEDQRKLEEIDKRLEEFSEDKDNEEFKNNLDITEYASMSMFSLEKALKDIDKKLLEINEELTKELNDESS